MFETGVQSESGSPGGTGGSCLYSLCPQALSLHTTPLLPVLAGGGDTGVKGFASESCPEVGPSSSLQRLPFPAVSWCSFCQNCLGRAHGHPEELSTLLMLPGSAAVFWHQLLDNGWASSCL